MIKLTQEAALDKCKSVHGNTYDYSNAKYISTNDLIQIGCPIHGFFWQLFSNHISGSGCLKCGQILAGQKHKRSLIDLIKEANIIHNFEYDYSNITSNFKNVNYTVPIRCLKHGIFNQSFTNHLKGQGCLECSHLKTGNKLKRNLQDLIKEANIIHKYKYNYDQIKTYQNLETLVPIICPIHGVFLQSFSNHIQGRGCRKCNGYALLNTDIFIQRAKLIHHNTYNYDRVDFINSKTKIIIKCNKCEMIFSQRPFSHLQGQGCPNCKQSKGELLISNIFKENNIKILPQKSFDDCKDKYPLRFDFYISDKNIIVEYDGWQPFYANDYFGGEEGFKLTQIKDDIKNKYCTNNNIPIIRIPYWLPKEDIKDILLHDINNIKEII